jgi:hypothetical protein
MNYTKELIDSCKLIIAETKNNLNIRYPLANEIRNAVFDETKEFPEKITFPERMRAIAEDDDRKCLRCGVVHGRKNVRHYCYSCFHIMRSVNAASEEDKRMKTLQYQIERGDEKFSDKIPEYDYVTCKICGHKSGDLSTHIIRVHKLSVNDYKLQFVDAQIKPERIREALKGVNNPAYQHNGRLSPWSKNFIRGYDEDRHIQAKENHRKWVNEHKEVNVFSYEYWLKEANGDEVLAKQLHTKFQTRDLSWFIEKFGDEEGPIRHQNKTEKWMKSFKKMNFSKISQILFDEIVKFVDTTDVYYATFERPVMVNYKNKEYIMKLENTYVRPDFVDLNLRKVIEFDGTYWHSHSTANPLREKLRDDAIKAMGFDIFHVNEQDYKNDSKKVIENCLLFLEHEN